MSLRYEQCMALKLTREFMRDLLGCEHYPRTKREMRKRASACLRHYPFLRPNGEPLFSNDNFPID